MYKPQNSSTNRAVFSGAPWPSPNPDPFPGLPGLPGLRAKLVVGEVSKRVFNTSEVALWDGRWSLYIYIYVCVYIITIYIWLYVCVYIYVPINLQVNGRQCRCACRDRTSAQIALLSCDMRYMMGVLYQSTICGKSWGFCWDVTTNNMICGFVRKMGPMRKQF